MLIQANSNITASCNIASKAVNIQSTKSGINSFLILSLNSVRLQYGKSNISGTSALSCSGFKVSYLKPSLDSNSQCSISNIKTYSTTKAQIKCTSTLECYCFDKDIQSALTSYVPPFIGKSKVFSQILRVQGNELTRDNALLKDLAAQFYLETATWGLYYWEKDLGIVANPSLSNEQRREKIKFKLQTTSTTITKKFFKSVMDAYYTSNIDEDFQNSKINITVTGIRGIPPRIGEMLADAEDLLPAHLIYEFIYTYLPWNELEVSNVTWNEIDAYTWDEFETAFLV